MITQLRDMGSARQSAEMAMENHQKPISLVAFKVMAMTFAVSNVERNSRFSGQVFHGYRL
jgi:hypothetical protein